jgi:hypothetical protein
VLSTKSGPRPRTSSQQKYLDGAPPGNWTYRPTSDNICTSTCLQAIEEKKKGERGAGLSAGSTAGARHPCLPGSFSRPSHRGQPENIAGGELKRIATVDHRVAILELDEAAIHRAAREDEAELTFPAVPVLTRPIFFVTIWF